MRWHFGLAGQVEPLRIAVSVTADDVERLGDNGPSVSSASPRMPDGAMPVASAAQPSPGRKKGSVAPPHLPGTAEPVPSAVSAPLNLATLAGEFQGTYKCAQGTTGLRLDLTASESGSVGPIFHASIPGLPPYDLTGQYDPATKQLVLRPQRWEGRPLPGYTMVGMQGTFDVSTNTFNGKIDNPSCGSFALTRTKQRVRADEP